MKELKFNRRIYKSSHKSASIMNHSTANIVFLIIENEYGEPDKIALEYDQLDDIINLCEDIKKVL